VTLFIRTPRLFLRPSWPEDWDELFALLDEDAVALNLGVEDWPRTVEETKQFVCRPRENLLPHFFIHLREDDGLRLIGGIGLGRSCDEVELGYWIAPAFWGHGYATEALRAVLERARLLGHRRVIASHFSENLATAKVLEKAGFRATGETKTRYSVTRGMEVLATTYAVELECPDYGCDTETSLEEPPVAST